MASIMRQANRLRAALSKGNGLSFGAWQMLPGSHLSRTMARLGFDWILIDCEHGNIAGKCLSNNVNAAKDLKIMKCMILFMPWQLVE